MAYHACAIQSALLHQELYIEKSYWTQVLENTIKKTVPIQAHMLGRSTSLHLPPIIILKLSPGLTGVKFTVVLILLI